ncbi:MAG: hypothetical protein IJS28_07080 [Synergistaceae bacterium]|nr:hypothetical protein [Synergistaceae bacterium]
MQNAIQVFSSQDFTVRTTRDEDGTVWFVARDIAEALEYSEESIASVNKLIANVPEIWKGRKRFPTIERGEQEMLCLTEQGVYFFLGRSDKPKALPYQMWVAGEVMPSLRETGTYSTKAQAEADLFSLQGAKFIYEAYGIEGNQLILALDKIYRRQTGFSALENAGIQLVAPQQTQLLTPTEIGKQYGLNAREVNNILAGAGFQFKVGGRWQPLELGKEYAVMLDVGKKQGEGEPVRQLKWSSSILPVFEEMMEASA